MLNRFFRRDTTTQLNEKEQLRLASLTLQGRMDRMLEEHTTRRLRYQPTMRSTCVYYS